MYFSDTHPTPLQLELLNDYFFKIALNAATKKLSRVLTQN